MARFGASQRLDPRVRNNKAAQLYLKAFGTKDTSSSHLFFMRVFRRLVAKTKIARVLDAGCGKGKFSFWVAQNYPGIHVDGCDLDHENVAICRKIASELRLQNVNFFVQDLTTLTCEKTYDFAFSNHVLEHIPQNTQALANLLKALKPGGHLYIQMPTAIQRRSVIGRKFLQAFEEWAEKEHTGQTMTLDSLSSDLRASGCTILQSRHTEGPVGELRFELEEMALNYFHSESLFAVMSPVLKLLGEIDSRMHPTVGNGILVLAQKPNPMSERIPAPC